MMMPAACELQMTRRFEEHSKLNHNINATSTQSSRVIMRHLPHRTAVYIRSQPHPYELHKHMMTAPDTAAPHKAATSS
jgi:hypothetical protein